MLLLHDDVHTPVCGRKTSFHPAIPAEQNDGHSGSAAGYRIITSAQDPACSRLPTGVSSRSLPEFAPLPAELSSFFIHLSDAPPKREGRWSRAAGLLLCAASAVLISISSTLVKVTAGKTSVFYVLLARGVTELLVGSVCLVMQMVVERRWISPFGPADVRHLLVARAVCGSVGVGLFFFCISQLPLGDASAAFFTTPIFTAVLATFVLGEPWTAMCTLAALCSLAGVVCIAQPEVLFRHDGIQPHGSIAGSATPVVASRVVAVLLALAGALEGGIAFTLVRCIGPRVRPVVHVLFINTSIILISLVLIATLAPHDHGHVSSSGGIGLFGWLAAVGVVGFASHWCLNRGLQIGQAGPGAFVINLDVAFAYVIQVCVLGRALDQWSLCGALLIVAAASMMVVQKMHGRTEGRDG
ncbi:unnamed protein product [Vitrella brassicaformis CCMP3155]|uniref:EamA domain-containing protein n=1 Tax=Vitrella brassicaformis (strain CCMP3155) TaxID=1169540 RepID=A0A0G4EEA8_VITBC|nr:unnamed protein product [Vitrella brassicaformis CCMP3155]|eukprot:CEL93889.1 unnamed protein product [Vitrella brassicaformis CCMP3155]